MDTMRGWVMGAGLLLLGCGPGATPATVADAQQGTPPAGQYADAVPASITTLDAGDVDIAAGATASNAFGWALHQRLAKSGGNVIWSPYSVSSVLGMGLAGARGRTRTEMATVMHAPDGGADAFAQAMGVHQRLLEYRAGADNTLRVANAIFAAPDARFLPDYVLSMGAAYGGGLNRIDFGADPEAARTAINGWAGKQTENLIPNLIPKGVIVPTTRAVLCNALYFQGSWESQFKSKDTQPRPFWISDTKSVQPPTMYRKGKIRIDEMETATVASFPYEGDTLSMVIILPDDRMGLAAMERRLTAESLQQHILAALGAKKRKDVLLYLPKWKARTGANLVPELKALGMQACFDADAADFSGMLEGDGIYVSHVLHQAVIEVDEEGTEAAAATAMVMKEKGAKPKSNVFRVDHPFLYAIVEHETKAILFLGRCVDPSKE